MPPKTGRLTIYRGELTGMDAPKQIQIKPSLWVSNFPMLSVLPLKIYSLSCNVFGY